MPSSQTSEVLTVSDYWNLVTVRLNDMITTKVRVRGIIRNYKVNGGNAYFDIAEDSNSTSLTSARSSTARISAIIWRSVLPQMQHFLTTQDFDPLGNDLEMVFIGSLNIYPPSGRVSFNVAEIDVDEMRRSQQIDIERIRAQLRVEGVFDNNRGLTLSEVPLKIALVTAETGTVQHDFRRPLEASGYGFDVMLMHTRVGTLQAADEIAETVLQAGRSGADLVVLLRGGGSTTDLAVFNTLEVCRAVATCAAPVWCAIGHAQDHVLANEVAHRAFDVPQSTGAALVEWVQGYLETAQTNFQMICAHAERKVHALGQSISAIASTLSAHSNSWASSHLSELSLLGMRLSHAQQENLSTSQREISRLATELTRSGLDTISQRSQVIGELRWKSAATFGDHLSNLRNHLPRQDAAIRAALARVSSTSSQLTLLEEKLVTRNPETVLRLGYAIVSGPAGKRINSLFSAKQLPQIDVHFIDGTAPFQPIQERT